MVEDKPQLVSRHAYTHEIRDSTGEWIWLGDEASIAVIFRNLSGQNFAGRPATAYADYLAWMRHFTAQSWPGRQDPLAAGQTIELAQINGESIARHTCGCWRGWKSASMRGRGGGFAATWVETKCRWPREGPSAL